MTSSSSAAFQPLTIPLTPNKLKTSKFSRAIKESTSKQMSKKKTLSPGPIKQLEHSIDTTPTLINDVAEILEPWDCPLCMEQVDFGDINFVPCECGYQVCRFCWHHIKSVLNDLCPACRRSYTEQMDSSLITLQSSPIPKNMGFLKKKKNLGSSATDSVITLDSNGTRGGAPLGNVLASRKHLVDVRVLQSNLVYVIGIPLCFSLYNLDVPFDCSQSNFIFSPTFISALEELLSTKKYFGNYGHIIKLVINIKGHHSGANSSKKSSSSSLSSPTVSAFLTFEKAEDAAEAIDKIDNSILEGYTLRATYGTTKYCAFFLRGQTCPNQLTCLYLHELGSSQNSYTKETLSHRQRDISLKRLFGVSPSIFVEHTDDQSDINSHESFTNFINPATTERSISISSIQGFDETNSNIEVSSANKETRNGIDIQYINDNSSPFHIKDDNSVLLDVEEKLNELTQISSLESRSSSRFSFVFEKQSKNDCKEKAQDNSNIPLFNLFESFKSPLSKSIDEDLFSFNPKVSTPFLSLNHFTSFSIQPESDEISIDSLKVDTFHSSRQDTHTSSKLQISSYSEAAKAMSTTNLIHSSFDNPLKKGTENKTTITLKPIKQSSISRKPSSTGHKLPKSRSAHLPFISNHISSSSKENDQKVTKVAMASSFNQDSQFAKPSNPFMFLLEEDTALFSNASTCNSSRISSPKSDLFPIHNIQKASLPQKNSKKKKKNELKKEIDNQVKNHIEEQSIAPTDNGSVNSISANIEQRTHLSNLLTDEFLKSYKSVIDILEIFIQTKDQLEVNPNKFHYIERSHSDFLILNSSFDDVCETVDSSFLIKYFPTIVNEIGLYCKDFDSSSVTSLLDDLQEYDALVTSSNDYLDSDFFSRNQFPIFENLIPNFTDIFVDNRISEDLRVFELSLSVFLNTLFAAKGPFSCANSSITDNNAMKVSTDFSKYLSTMEKLQATTTNNRMFTGRLFG